jgi:hypothetical protein
MTTAHLASHSGQIALLRLGMMDTADSSQYQPSQGFQTHVKDTLDPNSLVLKGFQIDSACWYQEILQRDDFYDYKTTPIGSLWEIVLEERGFELL